MKRGTAARLACWSVMAVVLIVLFLPAIGMVVAYFQHDDVLKISQPSEYDLTEMDEYTLRVNLDLAFSNGEGGYVEYGSNLTPVYSSTDMQALAALVKSSGETHARALDSDRNLKEQSALAVSSETDMKLRVTVVSNQFLTKSLDIDAMLGMGDENNTLRFTSTTEKEGSRTSMEFVIPWLLWEISATSHYDLKLDIDASYSNSFDLDVRSTTKSHGGNEVFSTDGSTDTISLCSFLHKMSDENYSNSLFVMQSLNDLHN